MKRIHLAFASFVLAVGLTACSGNDSNSSTTTSTDKTSTTTSDTGSSNANATNATNNTNTSNNNTSSTTTGSTAKMPLGKADSTFVMKAAMGGMMEVEAGRIAQQNAQSDRVKAFGSMMVNDHTNANQELMTLASSRGITVPTTLPADMQKHVDAMKNMKGKAFDSHYMSMMLTDHKKDVGEFEKESNSGNDADLKSWAAKTLPTLRTHLDSAQAISKSKM